MTIKDIFKISEKYFDKELLEITQLFGVPVLESFGFTEQKLNEVQSDSFIKLASIFTQLAQIKIEEENSKDLLPSSFILKSDENLEVQIKGKTADPEIYLINNRTGEARPIKKEDVIKLIINKEISEHAYVLIGLDIPVKEELTETVNS